MYLAMGLGVTAAVAGFGVSGKLDTAPGATIVLIAIVGFVAVTLGAGLVRRRLGAQHRDRPKPVEPEPEPHEVVLDRS
jgi:zinc transport system permease protein